MNRTQIAVLGLSVAAFGGAFVLFNATSAAPPPPQIKIVEKQVETIDKILVASTDISRGSRLTAINMKWQDWPKGAQISNTMIRISVQPKALEEEAGDLVRESIAQGEAIRADKVVKGANGGVVSALLPRGKRAVAVMVDKAGQFILPNDRVDVIRIYRDEDQTKIRGADVSQAETLVTNVRVISMTQGTGEATLEVTPEQAELLILSERQGNAALHLTLRGLQDAVGDADITGQGDDWKGSYTIFRFGSAQHAAK